MKGLLTIGLVAAAIFAAGPAEAGRAAEWGIQSLSLSDEASMALVGTALLAIGAAMRKAA
jgi:hypothetical protein